MSERAGSLYLVSSPDGETFASMVRRALGAVPARPGRTPRVAVSYAAAADTRTGRAFMETFVARAFAGADVTPFRVAGEADAMPPHEAEAIVAGADVVFLSGGDPARGAHVLVESGAAAWLRDAHARGASLIGISAGAMLLGAYWAEWPDPLPENEPFDGGRLLPCCAVAPDLVVDCHAEDDGWSELVLVRDMLRARGGASARFVGIPTGRAVIVHPDGSLEPVLGDAVRIES